MLIAGDTSVGTNNAIFIDSSANNYTLSSTIQIPQGSINTFSSTAPYSASAYGGSVFFDINGNNILTPSSSTSWSFGTGTFTIEGWINPASFSTTKGIIVSNFVATTFVVGQWKFGCNTATGQLVFTWATSTTLTSNVNSGANVVTANTWQHVAVVRNGTTITIYLNGTSVGSGTMSTSLGATGTVSIGTQQTGTAAGFNGYLSNIRIVKGTAVYTTAFTPPTAPLTAISGTQLLLGFTNAAVIDNAMVSNLQVSSTTDSPVSSASTAKYGSGSLYFTQAMNFPDSTKLQLGTGDFTIEGWVSIESKATPTSAGIVAKGTSTTGWSINISSTGKLQFAYTATSFAGATTLLQLTWYHFAVVRSGSAIGNLKIYLNGVLDATSTVAVTTNFNQTSDMYLGATRGGGAFNLVGNIDDLRITKGVARYTANFTPPQQSLPIQ
jgi:hypothetical protein